MYIKLFVFFIGSCLFLQLISAKSTSHSSENDSSENESSRDKFYLSILDDFTLLWSSVLKNGSILLDDVVKDVNKLETKSDALQANLTAIMSFVQDANKYDVNTSGGSELLELSAEFAELLNVFDKTEQQEPDNEEAHALLQSFRKNGGEKYEENVKEHFSEFLKVFSRKSEEYISNLSPADKEKDGKLLKWYDEYKAVKDLEKQRLTFPAFFTTYIGKVRL